MSTSLNEYFTEWVLPWMSTSLNEYFTEWVLHWMKTSLNGYLPSHMQYGLKNTIPYLASLASCKVFFYNNFTLYLWAVLSNQNPHDTLYAYVLFTSITTCILHISFPSNRCHWCVRLNFLSSSPITLFSSLPRRPDCVNMQKARFELNFELSALFRIWETHFPMSECKLSPFGNLG